LATDPDREGEAISWHLIEALKEKKSLKKDITIKRVVFNEITKTAVTEAMKNPRDIDSNLVDAQQARRALDYLVGFTLSPLLWRKLPGSRSAGRVQSVALRMICDRELEIEKFVTQEYWDILIDFNSSKNQKFEARLISIDGKKLEKFSITDEVSAKDIVRDLSCNEYTISSVDKKQQKRNPQPPFTTSSMQQEASRKLGFSAKKTMQIAQRLYEGIDIDGENVGLVTYMRTDGVSLSQEAMDETRRWISKHFGDKYTPTSQRIYKTKAKNAQEAHEAIRPTDVFISPESLKGKLDIDQYKLYDLIWKRTVACQMESVVLDIVTAEIESKNKKYCARAVGSTIVFDGFYKIYREDKDDEKDEESRLLPPLEVNEKAEVETVTPKQHFTEPPPRYTEASLVKRLEELGIGRPSTYASIISVLQERNYVKFEKKRFVPEERGMLVTAFLANFCAKYVEYDFTADLENQLDDVAAGKCGWIDLMHRFWVDFKANVDHASGYKISDVILKLEGILGDHLFPKRDGVDSRSCPSCTSGVLGLKLGKYGAFIACSNYPECKFTKQISNTDEATDYTEKVEDNTKVLGVNKDGTEVYLKKGPYGFYIQLGENADKKNKPQRVSVPNNILPVNVDLNLALKLLSLPIKIGIHEDTGHEMLVGIGKFGPYIKHDGKFVSIPKGEDFLNISVNRASEIVNKKSTVSVKKTK
jgi:DNA topoisomerase-1